ncbi:MAG: hypothetical protein IJ170_09010 [Ruminococcus sp.]|nr:hypothetical protein [Ruminococcus sp.]
MAEIKLVWDKRSMRQRKKRFAAAQDYVDEQCVEKMTPYVPVALASYRNAGKLRDSAAIQEPGVIVFTAPKARSDYYAIKNHKPPHGGNPNGTRLWFETMKHYHARKILSGTIKVLGGKRP